MKDNSINKNNVLAGWIDDFINSFAKSKEVKEEQNKTAEFERKKLAEININDLSEIVWNDETFYVYFDENDAMIFNVFGNVVTTLEGVTTMEEVNEKLNSKQVVSSNNNNVHVAEIDPVMETEINKALDYIDNYNENSNEDSSTEEIEVESSIDELVDEMNEEDFEVEDMRSLEIEETEEVQEVEETEEVETVNENVNIDELLNTKLVEMEEKLMSSFEQKMNELMDKMFARVNPSHIENLDLNVESDEVAKFEEEALETEQQISEENEIDRTTPEGRYNVDSEEELSEEELIVEENSDNELQEINEVDEIDEVIKEDEEIENISDDILELEEIDTEELHVEEHEEATEEVFDDSEMFDKDLELVGDDAEIFKEAKCPCCTGNLYKTAKLANSVEITCDEKDCQAQYLINLNTGKIYIK